MPRLVTPPQPTDVPHAQHIAFNFEHNGKVITAFVSYLLLEQITEFVEKSADMFRTNQDKLLAAAAAKFDVGKVDAEGYVRLDNGDIPALTWPRDDEDVFPPASAPR
jgi:hypothetical protein